MLVLKFIRFYPFDKIKANKILGKALNSACSQPFHRINPRHPTNERKFTLIFGAEQMLNLVKDFLHKVLPADNPGICSPG
ncbi:hypothetical protein Dthio_PD2608 [Desulfonatronospira thiodismutans ASO3-1]|uniref:Uncharacterized protein n=1 Tax=Desulfonatronospira thiodismutans ASO3-1 TaxID=555779 RepID=D6SKI9_9BACT|nr:hypothetical protein Dthio_PD2608 [Desulfonatronospira thiodismutans ASO3-1]